MTTKIRNFLHTRLCDMLGIEYPIMNAGMGSVAGPELVAAVSNAGGLGSLGTGREGPQEMRAAIRKVRSLTSKPFAVQLPVPGLYQHAQPPTSPDHMAFLRELKARFEIPEPKHLPVPEPPEERRQRARAIFEVVLEERVPVLVTFFGNPKDVVQEAHAHGVKVFSYLGNTKHLRYCLEAGSDAVVAVGWEAGGHGGQIGTLALIPQVVDAAENTPVLAAGGIMDGRGLVAALALGAVGVVCGSAFLLCHEAGPFADLIPRDREETLAPWRGQAIRQQLLEANDYSTVQSRSYSGGPFRCVANAWTEAWARKSAPEPFHHPHQTAFIRELIRGAYEARRSDLLANAAGQGVGLLKELRPARQVVLSMVEQSLDIAGGLFVEP